METLMAGERGGLTARRRSMALIRADIKKARDAGDEEAAKGFEVELHEFWDDARAEFARLRQELGWSSRFAGVVLETHADHVLKMEYEPGKGDAKAPSPRSIRLLRACVALRAAGLLDQWLRDEGITEQ